MKQSLIIKCGALLGVLILSSCASNNITTGSQLSSHSETSESTITIEKMTESSAVDSDDMADESIVSSGRVIIIKNSNNAMNNKTIGGMGAPVAFDYSELDTITPNDPRILDIVKAITSYKPRLITVTEVVKVKSKKASTKSKSKAKSRYTTKHVNKTRMSHVPHLSISMPNKNGQQLALKLEQIFRDEDVNDITVYNANLVDSEMVKYNLNKVMVTVIFY